MRFAKPPRRNRADSVVPMINVVFLLLIFFLMSARIVSPPPFELSLPDAGSEAALEETLTLFVSQDGTPAMGGQHGDAVWQALATSQSDGRLAIRADAKLTASNLAKILARLSSMGITKIDLAVRSR